MVIHALGEKPAKCDAVCAADKIKMAMHQIANKLEGALLFFGLDNLM